MNKILLAAFLVVLLLAFAFPQVAYAQYGTEDKIVLGGSYVLQNGETLDADLAVFGGSALLEETSLVTGDVVVLGGNVDSFGTVEGSLVSIGGNLTVSGTIQDSILVLGGSVFLQEQAIVQGDVTSIGGSIQQEAGAQIEGEVVNGFQISPGYPGVIEMSNFPQTQILFSPVWSGLWFIFRLFLWSALAALVTLFIPNPTRRVAKTIVDQPLLSAGVGLFTAVVAPIFLIVMAITIILIPVSLLSMLVLLIAWCFGRIALGMEIGNRIGGMFDRQWPSALSAGAGTFLLDLFVDGVGELIPCVGWLLPVFVGILGAGAVLLTRFGTHMYPPNASVGIYPAPTSPAYPPSPGLPPAPLEDSINQDVTGEPPASGSISDLPGL